MRNERKGMYIKEGLKGYKGGSVRLLCGSGFCVDKGCPRAQDEKEREGERNEAVRAGKTVIVTRRSYSSCVAA